jgi:hypothetical protein
MSCHSIRGRGTSQQFGIRTGKASECSSPRRKSPEFSSKASAASQKITHFDGRAVHSEH